MKKFNLSLVAVLAMSAFAVAGGDIAPVEPVVETPVVVEDNSAFYLGLAYGLVNYDLSTPKYDVDVDEDIDTFMFQAGYEFNQYVAVEGRYWAGFNDIGDIAGDFDTWGIYVKPQYPIGAFNLYALLGYASTTVEPDSGVDYIDVDGFSWGLGAEYKFAENLSVFVDYVSMSDTDEDFKLDGHDIDDGLVDVDIQSINFGVTYRF